MKDHISFLNPRNTKTMLLGLIVLLGYIAEELGAPLAQLRWTPTDLLMRVSNSQQACSVYCEGPILSAIQLSGIFPNSKIFVDMPMKYDPETVVSNFYDQEMSADDFETNRTMMTQFVNDNFYSHGTELASWIPIDWHPNPPFIASIENQTMRWLAIELNNLWLLQGKRISEYVMTNPQRHSFLQRSSAAMIAPLTNGGDENVIPSYWESYWIVRALLTCGMTQTAWTIISNLLADVAAFGFVPQAGRVYSLDRSQPPVLTLMIDDYLHTLMANPTNENVEEGLAILSDAFPLLEAEYRWWMSEAAEHVVSIHSVHGKVHVLNRYRSSSSDGATVPRPDWYKEDIAACALASTDTDRASCYQSIRTATERPTQQQQQDDGMVPVDLNAILFRVEMTLASIATALSNHDKNAYYLEQASKRQMAIEAVLWDNNEATWRDFNLITKSHADVDTTTFASWIPLWSGLLGTPQAQATAQATLPSKRGNIRRRTLLLSSSTASSRAQDRVIASLKKVCDDLLYPRDDGSKLRLLPPPQLLMLVEGLRTLESTNIEAAELADKLSRAWLDSNLHSFQHSLMHSKKSMGVSDITHKQLGVGFGSSPTSSSVALVLLSSMASPLLQPKLPPPLTPPPPPPPSANLNSGNVTSSSDDDERDLTSREVIFAIVAAVCFAAIFGVLCCIVIRFSSPPQLPPDGGTYSPPTVVSPVHNEIVEDDVDSKYNIFNNNNNRKSRASRGSTGGDVSSSQQHQRLLDPTLSGQEADIL